MKKSRLYIETCLQMLRANLFVYYKEIFWGELFNCFIWAGSVMFISTYILTEMGISQQFGGLMASGMIISVAFWDVWSTATNFISDMEGNQTVKYYLTLPVPAWLYFIKQLCYFSFRGAMQGIVMLPFGKLILMDRLNLSNFNLIQFIVIFISANVFCATLSLIMTSMVKDMNNVGDVGVRFLFPMWFLGGSQFSWHTLYGFSPKFAVFCLLNPLLYAMEAMRAAVLGQPGFINFWTSIAILWIFNIAFSWYGIVRMKKRLDCV